jgi:hypothetical protein
MDESLSFESLFEGAKKAAHRAMDDHGRKEYDEFALHAGIAVERLTKAALVVRNPLFLVEMRNGNTDMLLHFGGALEIDKEKVRTVGAKEGITRLRRMTVLPADPQLDLLIDLRNGTAHTTGNDAAKVLMPVFARTVEVLIADTGQDLKDFWGRWAQALSFAVTEQEDEILRDVQIRMAQARHAFDDRFAGLPDRTLEAIGEEFTATGVLFPSFANELWSITQCPACSYRALAMVVVDVDRDKCVNAVTYGVHCSFCKLILTGPDEVRASGIRNGTYEEAISRLIQGLTSATGMTIEEVRSHIDIGMTRPA